MDKKFLKDFQQLLVNTVSISEKFQALLIEEKDHLTSTDREKLTELLAEKNHLINALANQQNKILSHCNAMAIEPTYGAIRAFLYREGIDNAEEILGHWTKLKNILINAEVRNKTNEAILNELIRRNHVKLNVINNLTKKADTYGSTGQKTSQNNQGWVEQV